MPKTKKTEAESQCRGGVIKDKKRKEKKPMNKKNLENEPESESGRRAIRVKVIDSRPLMRKLELATGGWLWKIMRYEFD
jgi:hypothetical protein